MVPDGEFALSFKDVRYGLRGANLGDIRQSQFVFIHQELEHVNAVTVRHKMVFFFIGMYDRSECIQQVV